MGTHATLAEALHGRSAARFLSSQPFLKKSGRHTPPSATVPGLVAAAGEASGGGARLFFFRAPRPFAQFCAALGCAELSLARKFIFLCGPDFPGLNARAGSHVFSRRGRVDRQ